MARSSRGARQHRWHLLLKWKRVHRTGSTPVVAQADVPNASAYAQNRQVQPQQAQNGQGVHVYVSRSNQGTWLFAPNGNQGANS